MKAHVKVVLCFLKGSDVHPPQIGDSKVSIALLSELETFPSGIRYHSVHL